MASTRRSKQSEDKAGESSTPRTAGGQHKAGPKKRDHGKAKRAASDGETAGLPGVQKIKSALRQTTRLLAKDLAPDVRQEAERRLRTLQADLQRAELANKERTLALRYHKVKFFDRKKVDRKIKQIKKELETAVPYARQDIESRLQSLRVDLNYVIHYPKTKKYISLFPPEIRSHGDDLHEAKSKQVAAQSSKTDLERENVRTWIRERMEAGELSAEPELDNGGTTGARKGGLHSRRPAYEADAEQPELSQVTTNGSDKSKSLQRKAGGGGVRGDEFFGQSSDSDHSMDSEDDDEDDGE